MVTIEVYADKNGSQIFTEWLEKLRDQNAVTRIARRLDRLATKGNYGDHHALSEGVWELRIDYGPGYRVYYGKIGKTVVLLLCGGDKRDQDQDIVRAIKYFEDYKKRKL